MKLLLDENLPIMIKTYFSGLHEVSTVKEMGWSGKKNGELLGLLSATGFNGLVTIDKNLRHQQNLAKYDMIVCILLAPDNKLLTLRPYIEKLEKELGRKSKARVLEIHL